MNTIEIENAAYGDPFASKIFGGVFPLDMLPEQLKSGMCYVVNTDPKNLPGEHWLLLSCMESTVSHYFDSFGRPPTHVNIIRSMLSQSEKILYMDVSIQSEITSTCAYHCLFILFLLGRGYRMLDIILRFYDFENYIKNDVMVTEVISSLSHQEARPLINWDYLLPS